MTLDRDDTDERIARLEKLMEEARTKPAAGGATGPTEAKGHGGSAPVKVVDSQAAKARRRSKRSTLKSRP